MGRRERIDPAAEAAAWIAQNMDVAKEVGIIPEDETPKDVTPEQVVMGAVQAIQDATAEASRIASTNEGHNGSWGEATEL